MPRRRWIKLWTQEYLYGTTSEELELDEQALWIKVLALAGDSPEPGKIVIAPGVPPTDEQIAAIFKCPIDVWLRTKKRLQDPDVDKIYISEGIIHIKNWEKYQLEAFRTEYMKQYMRDYRKGKTTGKPNSKQVNSKQVNSKTIEQTRGEGRGTEDIFTTTTASENLAKISRLYEENVGMLTPMIGEKLKDMADRYPADWFQEALKEAVELEHRNLKYIEAILERWKVQGFKAPKKAEGGRGEKRPRQEQPAAHQRDNSQGDRFGGFKAIESGPDSGDED